MDELISRQAAIDALAKHEKSNGHNYTLFVDIVSECAEIIRDLPSAQPEPRWIPCSERLPIKEFEDGRKNKTVYDIYPCLVTRYSTHTDEPRTRVYVCKSYFDGEDFLLHGGYAPNEESDTENTIAWMPLPEPYKKENSDGRPD